MRSLGIMQKTHFEAIQAVYWSPSCYKDLELTTKPFTSHALSGLLTHMQNISLQSSGMPRKQNFAIAFGFTSDIACERRVLVLRVPDQKTNV